MNADEKRWARSTPDPGYALCPNCHGRGWCVWCNGTRRQRSNIDKLCTVCASRGECPLCEGEGQVAADHYTVTDSSDAPPAAPKGWSTTAGGPPLPEASLVPDAETVRHYLRRLSSDDPEVRVASVRDLASNPRASEDLLAACERLLADREIVLVYPPDGFGELRWLAADATAALRSALGRTDPVIVDDVLTPLSASQISEHAERLGLPASAKQRIDASLETLMRLVEAGGLSRRRIMREP